MIQFSKYLQLPFSDTITKNQFVPIDISTTNEDLKSFDVSSSEEWEKYIQTYLKKNKAVIAYGGYLEKRDIYNRSEYFSASDKESARNIHLGIDFWCDLSHKIVAVFDGEIHSFQNNTNYGDYGPTIILKHTIDNNIFYSLYGHLSLSSLENINVGDKISKGQFIAELGDATINGDYAPHLHFQLIKDISNNFGDYPGVCSQNELEFYQNNCPNPNFF